MDNFVDNGDNFDPNFKLSTSKGSFSGIEGIREAVCVDNSVDNGENPLIHFRRINTAAEATSRVSLPDLPGKGKEEFFIFRIIMHNIWAEGVDKPVDNPWREKFTLL